MAATIKDMEYTFADYLYPDQLMVGDIIKIDGEFYEVSNIVETKDNYVIDVTNDFSEAEEFCFSDTDTIEWYVLIDE